MKYKSDAYEAIHENARAGFEIGAISEERMKEYDEACIVQEGETAYEVEKSVEPSIRVMEHVPA